MIIISKHNERYGYGVELTLFDIDPIDMEVGTWEIIAIKCLLKLFGFQVVLAALEVSGNRATVTFLNCHLTVFFSH